MHTVSEMGTSVPAFLGKLWRLVEDPETDELICWASNGRSFFIKNQARFARELLPHYYKHNNMASFVRQLNMYGFHKKVSVELGGLKCDKDEMEFAHQYFCKDHPYLLDHIKRKIASNKSQDPSQQPIKPELMNKMLTEVRSLRGRQENFDSRLGVMKRENEALWRELALLRQKHMKQQHVVNNLIQFLASLVSSNRNSGLGIKRRYPLMIDDARRQKIKQNKVPKVHNSPKRPAIHELDAYDTDLDSEYIVAEMLDNDTRPTIESPERCTAEENLQEYYVDNTEQIPQEFETTNINASKKKTKIDKKERKNRMPIKILIPASENGEETREEVYVVEMPAKRTTKMQATRATERARSSPNRVISSRVSGNAATLPTAVQPKPVPFSTVRSSKLAAMVANMKKNAEQELDFDLESLQDDIEDTSSKDDSLIKLENILIVPDVNEENAIETEDFNSGAMPLSVSSLNSVGTSNNSPGGSSLTTGDRSPDATADLSNGAFGKFDFINATSNEPATFSTTNNTEQKSSDLSAKKSIKNEHKSMSLSCMNQGNTDETNYRMECDSHIDNMQNDLDNLREMLSGQNVSIDANTLLGVSRYDFDLFGTEDAMNPYGFPLNPELDPQEREIDDDHHVNDSIGLQNNRELMSYNSGNDLLDFEDDLFLGPSSSSPAPAVNNGNEGLSVADSLKLVDHKGNIFDSLIANNNSSQT
ncbi:heat shock factor protein isoform X2 [Copidosoma floridanum]|uniref:heat shock factor protein isoform X2 n=1 Tax=Copidosoma floridanum TaxID=29053 RepID=UPI0006C95232|nr:heat shock factor protein isoform X2 [Copidosoma floridanum]